MQSIMQLLQNGVSNIPVKIVRLSNNQSTSRMYNEIFHDMELCKQNERPRENVQKIDKTHQIQDKRTCENCKEQIANLKSKLAKEIADKNQKLFLMAEYEKKTREWFIETDKDIEKLKSEKRSLESECNALKEQLEITSKHLDTIEISFNDVHEKYNRAKQTIQILHRNVEILKQSLAEHQECIRQKHSQFLQLKEHATDKLNYANVHLNLIKNKFFSENSNLRATVNEINLRVDTLKVQLECKNRENAKLKGICSMLLKELNNFKDQPVSIKDVLMNSETDVTIAE